MLINIDKKNNKLLLKLSSYGNGRKMKNGFATALRIGTPNYVAPKLLSDDEKGIIVNEKINL